MIPDSHKIIVILGPTASGKTEWGIKLAQKFNGEIICADSRTVYKYFDIGTAKPTKKEMQGIKHYLLDFVDPKKVYTVVEFQWDALKAIKLILRKNKLPIIVGGSALYIYALTRNYQFPGQSDTKLRRELEAKSLAQLQAIVKKNKKISLNSSDFVNKRRLIRATEVFINYKLKIKNFRRPPLPYQFLKIGIERNRKEVYQRIDQRTEGWLKEGLVGEVKNLLRQGISKDRIIEFGLGYREVVKYLDGEIKTKEELIERINFSQHAFVRRQMTWFKKDKEIKWCKKLNDAEKLVDSFIVSD